MEAAHLNTTLHRNLSAKTTIMAQTPEQRAATSRANGARSRGPKTDAGKSISSRNSLTHGLSARTISLPNEDPAAVADRNREWADHFLPASPDACYLLQECVRATLLADRFHRAHDTAVANQIRDLEDQWQRERLKRVEVLRRR